MEDKGFKSRSHPYLVLLLQQWMAVVVLCAATVIVVTLELTNNIIIKHDSWIELFELDSAYSHQNMLSTAHVAGGWWNDEDSHSFARPLCALVF